jgi:7-cyano-7-deazaguanine reductase
MQLANSELGKKSQYLSEYSPQLLFPIPRQIKREELGLSDDNLPFYGMDVWNHYEVSWLNPKGKPQVAVAVIEISASSTNIIESKSMKLYFNSFNNTKIANVAELKALITTDLSNACASPIKLEIFTLDQVEAFTIHKPSGTCLDALDIEVTDYTVNPGLLTVIDGRQVCEQVYSNLLKSNCLVTHQPDWASIAISYCGAQLEHASLLKYIISFRNHNEFHEQCVERIFKDLYQLGVFTELTVSARFTRRGGLDINPLRSTNPAIHSSNFRLIRQ